jgi:hypothetical protein
VSKLSVRVGAMLGCALGLTACQNHADGKDSAVAIAPTAAQTSAWSDITHTDDMTDKVIHAIRAVAADGHSTATVECDEDGERLAFSSDLYLSANQLGPVLLRLDNAKPMDETAFYSDKIALLALPKKINPKEDFQRYLYEFQSLVAMMYLRQPHDRLRVRLTSFSGETRELDFKITGNEPKIAALEKACGIPNARPGQ